MSVSVLCCNTKLSTLLCFHCLLQVLHGGVNLLQKVDELKARSNATKQELEVRRRQKEEQMRRLAELQTQQIDLQKKYSSLEVCDVLQWLIGDQCM